MQDYRAFMTAFEHNMVSLTNNYRDKLYYLWQYTSGRAREIVKGYMGRDAEVGYKEAVRELESEYGDNYRIASAYRKDIENLKPFKGEDKEALKDFLTFLLTYNNAMKENTTPQNTDQTFTIQTLLKKLPFKIRDRWCIKAYNIKERNKTIGIATFQDFVTFMKTQVEIVTNSMYGDITDDQGQKCNRPRSETKEPK